jgi:hypothetical protein
VPPVRLEIRARLEPTQGLHYAIWLLGGDSANDWPRYGEIDITENNTQGSGAPVEQTPWWLSSKTFQSPTPEDPGNPWAYTSGTPGFVFYDTSAELADWHEYVVTLLPESLTITLDGETFFHSEKATEVAAGRAWPYETQPQLLIFSLKVGGDWVLPPAAEFEEAHMVIDYVRATRL